MNTAIIIGVLGLAAGALLLWAVVRVVNRGWRKSKGACAVMVVVLAFPALLGPSCWLSSWTGHGREIVSTVYNPLIRAAGNSGMRPVRDGLLWYSGLAAADGWGWQFRTYIIQYPDELDGTRRQAAILLISWGTDSDDFEIPESLTSFPAQAR